jgi:hypothetical protein
LRSVCSGCSGNVGHGAGDAGAPLIRCQSRAVGARQVLAARWASLRFGLLRRSSMRASTTRSPPNSRCPPAYYLAGNVGSAAVIVRQMGIPELSCRRPRSPYHAISPMPSRPSTASTRIIHRRDLTALGGYMRLTIRPPQSTRHARCCALRPMQTDRRASCSTPISCQPSRRTSSAMPRAPSCLPPPTSTPTPGGQRSPSRIFRSSFGPASSGSLPPASWVGCQRSSRCRPARERPVRPSWSSARPSLPTAPRSR